MDHVYRKRLPLHIEYRLIYSLTKDFIDASIYDTSLFNYMPDIDVYMIEDEEVNEEEFVSCTIEKYNKLCGGILQRSERVTFGTQ